MKLFSRLCGCIALLALLTACGQRGPLFLPDAEKVNQAKSLKDALEKRKAEQTQEQQEP